MKPDDNTRRQRSQPPGPSVSEEFTVTPEDIPEGPVRHGRESFTVQELEIKAKSLRYWLEQWLTPEGKTISGRPPGHPPLNSVSIERKTLSVNSG